MESSHAARTAVLLDQFPLWLDAVEHAVARLGIQVVGKTGSPDEALSLLEEHEPDVLVAETETLSAELDGLGCIKLARRRVPGLKVVVLSRISEWEHLDAAFEAGADAYVFCVAELGGEELKLVARTQARNVPRRGDMVALDPRPNEAHLFDSGTGERLEPT